MKKIKKGDRVHVLSGKDRGKNGVVKKVIDSKVIVDGLNLIKKHVKPNPQLGVAGGIIEREAAISASNVAVIDNATGKPAKVSFKTAENGEKVRVFKALNKNIV